MQTRNIFAFAAMLSACYSAELDHEISGVFVCEDHVDCALGSRCSNGICVANAVEDGPALQIVSPPQLEIFGLGVDPEVEVIVAGKDLVLSDEDAEDPLAGYIDVELDGAIVDTVLEGDLGDGISLAPIPLPQAPGLHHIRLVSRRLDGEPFEGELAEVHSAFWVDNGEEQVGILEPPPSARIPIGAGEPLTIEVASLNFTLVNPGFVAPDELSAAGQGYVHLYVDADVPTCLPGCNFDYQSAIVPAGLSRVNRIVAEEGVVLLDHVGTVRLQIVAQTTTNEPYHRDDGTGDVVFHSIAIQSVAAALP